jgi:uncharacterized protein YbjQ (UPF0145 family)
MYNEIRHTALARLKAEAAAAGANAVVDVDVRAVRHGAAIELLLTGTASHHPKLGDKVAPAQVVTSELSGEELWNLAKLGLAPRQLVMATSVYSLGVTAGIGTMFKAMSKGELPEVTQLVYSARENCIDLLRREATSLGATQVVGNRLSIVELQPGLIEIFCVGTAVRAAPDMPPESPALISQAVITEKDSFELTPFPLGTGAEEGGTKQGQLPPACGCLIALAFLLLIFGGGVVSYFVNKSTNSNQQEGPR